MTKRNRIVEIVEKMSRRLSCPMTVKMRTGWNDNEPLAGKIIELLQKSNAEHGRLSAIFVHGRSRQHEARKKNCQSFHSIFSGGSEYSRATQKTSLTRERRWGRDRWDFMRQKTGSLSPTIKSKRPLIVKSQLKLPAKNSIFKAYPHWTAPHFRYFPIEGETVTILL